MQKLLLPCLAFSGLTALVYEILWTRLLGFVFGTTTEAIGTVLAVFFGGLALGNLVAARCIRRLRRPLGTYALLELFIGAFALLSLPLLRRLEGLYDLLGPDAGPTELAALRVLGSAGVLLPPTVAMGATLPVVARGVVRRGDRLGRSAGLLYAANTLGAVAGAYLSGFWLLPGLGLTRSIVLAAGVNLAVAGTVFALAARRELPLAPPPAGRDGPEPAGTAVPGRAWFLLFFGISGFVAIGYEMVWARLFGIVMEGTLYGFAAVLCAYLLGIAAGSAAIAPVVDRIRDLPRTFGLLHAGIALSVAAGLTAVPYLPWAEKALARLAGEGGVDAVHLLFLLSLPVILLPAALFGAAFPILVRIYTRRAEATGRGIGLATAVNTAGSIGASLTLGFWLLPTYGMDATLYGLLLLDLLVALLVLLGFQESRGRERLAAAGSGALLLLLVSLSYGGVHVDAAVAGRQSPHPELHRYRAFVEELQRSELLRIEGRASVVTVYRNPRGYRLRTNGLPESGVDFRPPYVSLETVLLGVLPYLLSETPERALVVGLGGGNTVGALLDTRVREIEVVELEKGVVDAVGVLYGGRRSPLEDPRVRVVVDDGRNHLLRRRHAGGGGYDLIASQPSHPWILGAASLFTEEYFALARENLAPGGVMAAWVNGFRTDPESLLAVARSFERVFPGALLFAGGSPPAAARESLILVGARTPLRVDVARARRRLAEPALQARLGLFDLRSLEDLLARSEGPLESFAALGPPGGNTDDNAFVETRIPRHLRWERLDFSGIEARLAPDAPVLPPLSEPVDLAAVARALLAVPAPGDRWPLGRKLRRLLGTAGPALAPYERELLAAEGMLRDAGSAAEGEARLRGLARTHRSRPEALRALGRHLAARRGDFAAAGEAFVEAYRRSRDPEDAFLAGRALFRVNRTRARSWFARIAPEHRATFPRLAWFEAEYLLEDGAPPAALRDARSHLLRYRNTEDGRRRAEVDETLARLAERLGEHGEARRWRSSAAARRQATARSLLDRARAAWHAGRLAEARSFLDRSESEDPGQVAAAELRARIAAAVGDRDELLTALRTLRSLIPDLRDAVAAENRLRAELGLPLLPPRSAEALVGDPPPLPTGASGPAPPRNAG